MVTKKKPARKRGVQSVVLDIPVDFGGVSIGESTARLGLRINREQLNIMAADEIFCGHRLACKLTLGKRDESQGELVADLFETLSGQADVKRLGLSADTISTGLTFSLADIDVATLAKFSKGCGRLLVETVAEIPMDSPANTDGDDGNEDDGDADDE